MYCQNCGSALSQDARFCQSCGKAQSPAQPLPPVQPPPIAAPIRAVQPQKPKSKVLWLVIGGIVLLVIIIGTLGKSPSDNSEKTESSATTGSEPTAQDTQFNALTPSEHLSQAKAALSQNATAAQIEEGLRHLRAIPETSPEAVQAKTLTTKLVRAQHLAEAKLLIDSAPVDDLKANLENLRKANDEIQAVLQQNPHDKDALKLLTLATNKGREALGGSQQTREAFAQDLQQRLTSMGYAITVWVHGEGADSGHKLNLDSEMFKDTAAFLGRGRRGQAQPRSAAKR